MGRAGAKHKTSWQRNDFFFSLPNSGASLPVVAGLTTFPAIFVAALLVYNKAGYGRGVEC